MFDLDGHQTPSTGADVRALDSDSIRRWVAELAGTDRQVTDAERIDQIRALEDLKNAAAAAQARATADFDASQRQAQADAGVPVSRQGQGVGEQVALARRESPHRGKQHVGLARVLTTEMPDTLAALTSGKLSEYGATLLARETACSTVEDRRTIDATLAGDAEALAAMSNGRLVAEARRLAYRLDPESVVKRRSRAEADRRVTCRPAPDTMSYLTGHLPVAQGVSVIASLRREADARRAAGDDRTRGQIMADTLVERVTGQATASAVPVAVQLVMTDRTLLAGDKEPAHLPGYGIVPSGWARQLVSTAVAEAQAWVRRLYVAPTTGQLIAMDSRQRTAPGGLAALTDTRDQTCRTPWCEAPIRHHDHVVPHDAGGETSEANTQGLCEGCNYAKEAMGWCARPRPGPRHTVEVITPTGHRYTSTAPPLPGLESRASRMEIYVADLMLAG